MVDLFYQPCSHDESDLRGNGDSNDWNAVLSWVHFSESNSITAHMN